MADLRPLPLFAWQQSRRAARRARRRRAARIGALAAAGLALLALPALAPPRPLLVWNASASAPIGLYRVTAPVGMRRGDWVLDSLPADARALAADRGYLPRSVPAVKRIAGVAPDFVCADGGAVRIAGEAPVARLARDGAGRPLPAWRGCRRLRAGELFLLNGADPASFDSRYIGPVPARSVIGRATLLWAR